MAQEIWQHHRNLDYSLSNPNLLELALNRVSRLEPCPEETELKLRSLVSDISRDLTTEVHILWIENVSQQLLQNSTNGGISFSYLQTRLCALQPQILSQISPELFDTLRSSEDADNNDKLTTAIAKIRYSFCYSSQFKFS